MGKPALLFRDRTIPRVAQRLDIPPHQLRRAVSHGDVEVKSWAGTQWITPAEEERLRALLAEIRAADARYRLKGQKQRPRPSAASPA
jgi:hypothetical protein